MDILLLATIGRIVFQVLIAAGGLVAMVLFVQHNPDSQSGMIYIWAYCCPVLALFTVFVNSMAVKDYLYPEWDEEEQAA